MVDDRTRKNLDTVQSFSATVDPQLRVEERWDAGIRQQTATGSSEDEPLTPLGEL